MEHQGYEQPLVMELGLCHQGENQAPDSSYHFVKNVLVAGLDQYYESQLHCIMWHLRLYKVEDMKGTMALLILCAMASVLKSTVRSAWFHGCKSDDWVSFPYTGRLNVWC